MWNQLNKTLRLFQIIAIVANPGGILIQQRLDTNTETFDVGWNAYAFGFPGANTNSWIGNSQLHHLTSNGTYRLTVEVQDKSTQLWHCYEYEDFMVDNATTNYTLHVGGYLGPPGEDGVGSDNLAMFTTKDTSGLGYFATVVGGGFWYGKSTSGLSTLAVINGNANHFYWPASPVNESYQLMASRMWLRSAN